VAIRGATTAGAATGAWLSAGFVVMPRRASTVALVALVSTQLAQTLIDSHSPLVVSTAVGSLALLGALISTPGVSQLLGCVPLDPVGWATALAAAGTATAAAAIAPRVVSRFQSTPQESPQAPAEKAGQASPEAATQKAAQSSTWRTPQRNSTAYSSRNGTARTRATVSVNGSAGAPEPEILTAATLRNRGVEKSKPT
jgi:H+-transporting ATPase